MYSLSLFLTSFCVIALTLATSSPLLPRGKTPNGAMKSSLLVRGGASSAEDLDLTPVVDVASAVHLLYGLPAILVPAKVIKALFNNDKEDEIPQASVRFAGIFATALAVMGILNRDECPEKALNAFAVSFLASAVAGWKMVADDLISDKIMVGVNTLLGLFCGALSVVKKTKNSDSKNILKK